MRNVRRAAIFVVFVVVLALVMLEFKHLQHWIAVHSGTVNESGPYYGFWSGFGSDLGEATLVGGLITIVLGAWHHHNCHTKSCWRLGRPVEGTPYVACHRHHPAHDGDSRNVPVEQIHQAHAAHMKVVHHVLLGAGGLIGAAAGNGGESGAGTAAGGSVADSSTVGAPADASN
jgi:hypothetical protein